MNMEQIIALQNQRILRELQHPAQPVKQSQSTAWLIWCAKIWDALEAQFPDNIRAVNMCLLEQKQFRSNKETLCINCGDPGTVKCETYLIKSVSHYFMCAECANHFKNK